jgi:predicted PurR-regulated permease PerM
LPVVKAAPESAARSVLLITQAVVVNAVTIVVLTFFLLATRPASLARAAGALRGPAAARRVLIVFAALRKELGRYFATVALINCGLGLATGSAMALLDMPNPALWGVVAATLNFVPYVGPATTLCVLTVVALATFDALGSVLAVAGTFLLLTTIEGQIVQPIAVGHRLAVSPLVVIIALMFWGWLWGIPGLALAVPLVLSVKAICAHVQGWKPIAEAMAPAPRWSSLPRRLAPRTPAMPPPRSAGGSP